MANKGKRYCVEIREDAELSDTDLLSVTIPVARILDEPLHHSLRTMSFALNGMSLGEFTTANVSVLPLIPGLAAGCGLNDMISAWKCDIQLRREEALIGSTSVDSEVDTKAFDFRSQLELQRLAHFLGLKPRAEAEIQAMQMAS